jgi:hypothetical protein
MGLTNVLRRTMLLRRHIDWRRSDDAEFPYVTEIDGKSARLRINDFPAEPLYTIIVDDREVGHIDDWPQTWSREPS